MSDVLIVAAALLLPDGEVISQPLPARHAEILRGLAKEAGAEINCVEGFITSDDDGSFVDRSEAAVIALASGQIARLREPALLYTCDLRVGKKLR